MLNGWLRSYSSSIFVCLENDDFFRVFCMLFGGLNKMNCNLYLGVWLGILIFVKFNDKLW